MPVYTTPDARKSEISGFDESNYTQVPNKFFDQIMAQISDLSEMKVALALFRLTFGWQRQSALIQFKLADLAPVTKLKRAAIHHGLQRAIARGYAYRVRVGEERGKPAYAYGLHVGKSGEQATVYYLGDFKDFNKVKDARRARGSVHQDEQTGERLFTIKDSTVHQDEQSGNVSYIQKKKKHTPLTPQGENRVCEEGLRPKKADKKADTQGSKSDPPLPSSDLPLGELYPDASAFLTDERRAAFAGIAPGFDADEVTGAWLGDYATERIPADAVESRWERYARSWFRNRMSQPRYAAAIAQAKAAQAEAAMALEDRERRDVLNRARELHNQHLAQGFDLVWAVGEYRRLCAEHPAVEAQLVKAYENLRRRKFDLELPPLDPTKHPEKIPMVEWDRAAVEPYARRLFARLNQPRTPFRHSGASEQVRKMYADMEAAWATERPRRLAEYEAIRQTFPDMNLPPLDVPIELSTPLTQQAVRVA